MKEAHSRTHVGMVLLLCGLVNAGLLSGEDLGSLGALEISGSRTEESSLERQDVGTIGISDYAQDELGEVFLADLLTAPPRTYASKRFAIFSRSRLPSC